MKITHLYKNHPNALYQKAARAQRLFNTKGKTPPADILLRTQLMDDSFIAYDYNPILFAPTPAQRALANALTNGDDKELRFAVRCYLMLTAPDSIG